MNLSTIPPVFRAGLVTPANNFVSAENKGETNGGVSHPNTSVLRFKE